MQSEEVSRSMPDRSAVEASQIRTPDAPQRGIRLEQSNTRSEPRLKARLLQSLLQSPQVTPRRLRAIEHLFLEVLTRPGRGANARELLEPETIDFHLANLLPDSRASSSRSPAKRYHRLCEEALSTRSFEDLERRRLLIRARATKYELGGRYLEPDTIKAAMQCLVLLEQLVDDPGYVGGSQALAPWRRGRLSVEARSASIAGYDAEQDLADGDTSSLDDTDLMVVDGKEAASLLEVEGEAAPRAGRPVVTLKPASLPGRAGEGTREKATPRGWSAPSASRVPEKPPLISQRSGPTLVTLLLSIFIAVNLACIAFAGVQWASAPLSRVTHDSARYQAYRLVGSSAKLPFARASRLHEVLLLTADARWSALDRLSRQDLMVHLTRHLMGRDGIQEILVVDSEGQRLALASPSNLEISPMEAQH